MTNEELKAWNDKYGHKPPEHLTLDQKVAWMDGQVAGMIDGVSLCNQIMKKKFNITLSSEENK